MVLGRKKDSDDPVECLARKDYDRAINIYRDRIGKQPENSNLRLALGDALLLAGRADEAIQEYRDLAAHYTEVGFIVKAVAIYKKILRLRPTMMEIEHCLMELSDKREPALKVQNSPQQNEISRIEVKSEPGPLLETDTLLFRDLSGEEFREVVSRLTLRHFDEGTIILAEGDPGESMFIIVNGEVSVNTEDFTGKQISLASLREGEFFGEVSILTGRPRTATIVTNTGTDLLELTREDYDIIVNQYPHVREVLKDSHHQRAHKTIQAIIQSRRVTD